MLRMAFVLFTVLLVSISVVPSSSAEAGYYGARYGGQAYRGGYGYRADYYGSYGYRAGYYGSYRSAYYAPRYHGRSGRRFTAPYYVNGCYNGYSHDGVYCHVYVGCPYSGHWY